MINGQEYISSNDGTLLMYVNIWGHVKTPCTYLVYEGIDLMTLISLAGGPLSGANLSRIKLIQKGNEETINLSSYLKGDSKGTIVINPHDTIYIEEKISSKIFLSSNLSSIFLSILNIALTLDRTK